MYLSGFENMKRLTRRVAREGARIVVGGHSTVPFAKRGEAPWRELELLVESGFTPLEAIQAATGTAAAFLYRESDVGTLRAGRLADLIVLSGDPLRPGDANLITAARKRGIPTLGSVRSWDNILKHLRTRPDARRAPAGVNATRAGSIQVHHHFDRLPGQSHNCGGARHRDHRWDGHHVGDRDGDIRLLLQQRLLRVAGDADRDAELGQRA